MRACVAALLLAGPLEAALRQTPLGARPSECVLEAPHGSVLSAGAAGQLLLRAPGTEAAEVQVPESCHAFEAERLRQAVPDGWLSSAGAYYTEYSSKQREMQKFTGKFTVPPAPSAPLAPESVYYFIGLEDRTMGALTSIHQPVLTWGDETEGGLGGWHLWSWTCCPGNVTWHSEDLAGFAPGDTIYGRIEKTADATWEIDSAFKDSSGSWKNTTLVSQVGNYNFNYADVTLEVYNITSCEQVPVGTSEFTELEIGLSDGSAWMPSQWYVTGSSTACSPKTSIHDVHTISISTNGGTASIEV